MADGIFIVSGSDVAKDAGVGTNSTGGDNGMGSATISGGQSVFEADDIIVISVKDVTSDGQIGQGSAVSDMTVFDNIDDYQAWLDSGDDTLVKYNYRPMNPGQTATVQSDLSGLGDGYVKFNANVLVPEDGGPWPGGSLTVAPGTGIGTNGGAPVTLNHVQNMDMDGDGKISEGIETGDGKFYVGDYVSPKSDGPPAICFTRGTLIATPEGERPIEQIAPGDLVMTLDNGAQPVRWVGQRSAVGTGRDAPIFFETGVLGNYGPLGLSPNHRVLLRAPQAALYWGQNEVLVAAKFLIGRSGIRQVPTGVVFYHHLMLDRHEILIANGAPCESLLPGAGHLHPLSDRLMLSDLDPRADYSPPKSARPCLRRHELALLDA